MLVENTAAWLRKAGQDLSRVERCLADKPPDVEDALKLAENRREP